MEELREFYYAEVYKLGAPEFNTLTDEEKRKVSGTFAFASFKLDKRFREFGATMKQVVDSFKRLSKSQNKKPE